MEIPILIDDSLHIAWDYLNGTGEIADGEEAGRFLTLLIQRMVRSGELRRLMLANRAITAYKSRKLRLV